jgi:hypothetical protein
MPTTLQWVRGRSIAELATILTYSDFKDLQPDSRAPIPQVASDKIWQRIASLNLLISHTQITRE